MTLRESVKQLAEAIRRASAEHGRPNSFGCKELWTLYGGPTPTITGQVAKYYSQSLWGDLGGGEKWGSKPVYVKGRFYV